MRGRDLTNTILPEELLFSHIEGSKSDCDSCSLVCKRWMKLERISIRTLRIAGSSGNPPDILIKLLVEKFVNVRNVFIDERLPVSIPPIHSTYSYGTYQYSRRKPITERKRSW
ncbi:hypothetical protein MKX01_037668 [Papaver californicum]|nr:hypothetical protein MKX01_037668 [Papaver californicum]